MAAAAGGGVDEGHRELPLVVGAVLVVVGAEVEPELGLVAHADAAAPGGRRDDGVVVQPGRLAPATNYMCKSGRTGRSTKI